MAAIDCLNSTGTMSRPVGAEYVRSVAGRPPKAPVPDRTCSGCDSEYVPLDMNPGLVAPGSLTVSLASPPVETTAAVIVDV